MADPYSPRLSGSELPDDEVFKPEYTSSLADYSFDHRLLAFPDYSVHTLDALSNAYNNILNEMVSRLNNIWKVVGDFCLYTYGTSIADDAPSPPLIASYINKYLIPKGLEFVKGDTMHRRADVDIFHEALTELTDPPPLPDPDSNLCMQPQYSKAYVLPGE